MRTERVLWREGVLRRGGQQARAIHTLPCVRPTSRLPAATHQPRLLFHAASRTCREGTYTVPLGAESDKTHPVPAQPGLDREHPGNVLVIQQWQVAAPAPARPGAWLASRPKIMLVACPGQLSANTRPLAHHPAPRRHRCNPSQATLAPHTCTPGCLVATQLSIASRAAKYVASTLQLGQHHCNASSPAAYVSMSRRNMRAPLQ